MRVSDSGPGSTRPIQPARRGCALRALRRLARPGWNRLAPPRRIVYAVPAGLALTLLAASPAQAADAPALGIAWSIPFLGILLSIALAPLLVPRLWHHHYGLFAMFWGAAFLLPFALVHGAPAAGYEFTHVLLHEYLPFMALLLALYTAGGGVLLRGNLVGTPGANTALLAIGTLAASAMGTTGASMVLIRPFLRANAHRQYRTHSFVFFIFLVSNVGGSLTPLGDPPLYLGFLAGVPFFWPTRYMAAPFALVAVLLLLVYFVLDRVLHAREPAPLPSSGLGALRLEGSVNVVLLGAIVLIVLLQGVWRPGSVALLGQAVPLERLVAIALLVGVTLASVALTPTRLREANGFAWGAIVEVAKLFAAIFLCMAPVLAILRQGEAGAFGKLVALTSDAAGQPIPWVYFWLSGGLSSFLDNAPTYLVFFNLAGGDPAVLTTRESTTLLAISCGSVFMGANSYIGNAPNFMVKAIVEESRIPMPSFFAYCGWAALFLLPCFVLVTLVFFR